VLKTLNALDSDLKVTALGRAMSKYARARMVSVQVVYLCSRSNLSSPPSPPFLYKGSLLPPDMRRCLRSPATTTPLTWCWPWLPA
jgi:hypothetical protein